MANDITSINSNRSQMSQNQSASAKSRNEASQGNNSQNASATADLLTLTDTASRLKNIEQKLSNASSVDSDRIAEVQSAISNGDYNVDSDRIADKMMEFEGFMG